MVSFLQPLSESVISCAKWRDYSRGPLSCSHRYLRFQTNDEGSVSNTSYCFLLLQGQFHLWNEKHLHLNWRLCSRTVLLNSMFTVESIQEILLNGNNESTAVEWHLRGWSPDNLPGNHDDGQWITLWVTSSRTGIENAILLSPLYISPVHLLSDKILFTSPRIL